MAHFTPFARVLAAPLGKSVIKVVPTAILYYTEGPISHINAGKSTDALIICGVSPSPNGAGISALPIGARQSVTTVSGYFRFGCRPS